jgi:hypothetical protein
MKLLRSTLQMQTVYYLITALWPLIDIKSFMVVTGPKTDTWLVKTVAVVLLAITCCFITQLITKANPLPTAILAIACCVGLTYIDCYYALNGTISKIYLLDAVLEIIFLVLWLIILFKLLQQPKH